MKQTIIARVAALAILTGATPVLAQTRPAGGGLNELLGNDNAVLVEVSNLELKTLQEYLFKKNNIPPDQQAAFMAVQALRSLGDASLSNRQRTERIRQVSLGIDQVLISVKNPTELMRINRQLYDFGAQRLVNSLEYFGENTRTQSQLQPIAEAIDKVYDKAHKLASAQATEIEGKLTAANANQLTPQWEKATELAGLARYSGAANKHVLALSLQKADEKRAAHAKAGIEVLTEYEAEEFDIQAQARLAIGKLHIDIGSKESLEAAKKKLAEVIVDPKGTWAQKFEAMYFNAVADVISRDFKSARTGHELVLKHLQAQGPSRQELEGAQAAADMLDYRILAAEAEALGPTPQGAKVNEQAVASLQKLLQKRPDLRGIINEQLIARLPDQPDMKKLDGLLLTAMVGKANDELLKKEGEAVDRKVLQQGILAAQEVVRRVPNDGLTQEDADKCMLLLGAFHVRLGNDVDGALALLDHVEKFRNSPRRQMAFDNALNAVLKLRREKPTDPGTLAAYNRFLPIAVSAPFERKEFAFAYARLLLQRNLDQMRGQYNAEQRAAMANGARRAAELFRQDPEPERQIHARYYEMLAYDQLLSLAEAKSAEVPQLVAKAQTLAGEVNQLADAAIAANKNPDQARSLKVQTMLLAANLAKYDQGPQRAASLQRALDLLSSFEKDVQGLPNAGTLMGDYYFTRVNYLMTLNRPDEALESLGKFLESRSGDEGVKIVFDMLEALGKEFEKAENDKDTARMAELAGHRARVSGYLVDRVAKSNNPKLRPYLPKYREFNAKSLQIAASLEKDPLKKKGYLASALKIYEDDLAAAPDNKSLQLAIALTHYDMENYHLAQPVFVNLLNERVVGRPLIEEQTSDGPRMVPNNLYWEVNYKLLKANLALSKAKTPGFDHDNEETKNRLKGFFIQFPEPGGPRWGKQFDELRKELIPDWAPEPAQPVTQPTAVGASR